jgi:diguanylate cyclase
MTGASANSNRQSRLLLWSMVVFSAALLSIFAYAWVNHELASAFLVFGLSVVAAAIFCLILRIQLIEAQRDRAVAWSREAEWRLAELTQSQAMALEPAQDSRLRALEQEITELRAREQQLIVQAHHDDLTGLANRFLLADRFQLAADRCKRHSGSFALLMVDLNGFKRINDKLGHSVGDAVLIATAQRLVKAVRSCDTVARLGGDEFVLIIESQADLPDFARVGQKLVDSLFEPIRLENGAVIHVGASLGMASFPDDGADLNTLLSVADQAMYECKSTGQISIF